MSFLGTLGKIAGGVIGAGIGGPIGAVAGAILTGAGSGGGGVKAPSPIGTTGIFGPRTLIPGAIQMPTFGPASPGPGSGSSLIPHMACGPGYHNAKTKGPLGGLLASKCVRNRRMNVANTRALRRSIRRLKGFEKLARRTLSITSPGPKKFRIKARRRR